MDDLTGWGWPHHTAASRLPLGAWRPLCSADLDTVGQEAGSMPRPRTWSWAEHPTQPINLEALVLTVGLNDYVRQVSVVVDAQATEFYITLLFDCLNMTLSSNFSPLL